MCNPNGFWESGIRKQLAIRASKKGRALSNLISVPFYILSLLGLVFSL